MRRTNHLVIRTKDFAYDVYHLIQSVKINIYNKQLVEQLIDSAFSVASNYRASQRGKSKRGFIHKIKITLEETDESFFWLNCLNDLNISDKSKTALLIRESEELIAIMVTILNKMDT